MPNWVEIGLVILEMNLIKNFVKLFSLLFSLGKEQGPSSEQT